ncbi:MAG: aspartate aminotransferase family protein [Pseudomonadota bacterium]
MSTYPLNQSKAYSERAREVLPGGNSRSTISLDPHSIYVTHGEGSRVFDVDGNSYVDFNNNYTSLILGHANAAVNEAVAAQIALGSAFAFGTVQEIEHAELLTKRIPGFEKIRFMNSGSEAVMNALKAARAFTGRPKIAKCEGAYHGSYDYAEVSLSAGPEHWDKNAPPSVPYSKGTPQGVLDDVVVIPYHDTMAARELLTAQASNLSAVLFDPVASRVGMIPPSAEYIEMLQEFCTEHGVLLIFDEVIAFRLGYLGAQGVYDVTPDLTALGKIIGGGFPVGAVAGSHDAMAVFEAGGGLPHGGTFNANPVTMVAGSATMKAMDEPAFDALNELGEYARASFREAFASHGMTGQVTGQGSLFRIHLTDRPLTDYRSVYPTAEDSARMASLHKHLLAAGHFISTYGMVCLSTETTRDEVDALVADVVDFATA